MDRSPETDLSIPANFGAPQSVGASANPGVSGTIAGSVLPLRRAEELIATLPGVLSVRIVPGDTGAVDEIHVLTTDAVPPKATVRNIESALIAQLGMRVNHRKISIATTLDSARVTERPAPSATSGAFTEGPRAASAGAPPAGQAGSVPPPPGAPFSGPPSSGLPYSGAPYPGAPASYMAGEASGATAVATPPSSADPMTRSVREAASDGPGASPAASEGRRVLIFEDVEVRRSRTKGVLCRVTLSREQSHFVGESEGQETERSRVELAARATLQAIAQAASASAGGDRSLALEGSKLIDAFDREFIFVSVTARIGREMVVLTGSCEVKESAETSAVLAVLDATNRWLHLER